MSNWKNNQLELISERKGDITGIFQRSKEEGVGGGWGRSSQTLSQPVYLLYCLDVIFGVFLLKLEV